MSYVPPGVSIQAMPTGINSVYLSGFKPIDPDKLAKFQAQVVFIATYKHAETAVELDQVIKFNGSKADFYAGQTIDRLFQAAGLPAPIDGEPLDMTALLTSIDGKAFQIEINDKGYVQNVLPPLADGEETPF